MKTSVFIGTSLDGFIARANGDLDFLPPGGGEPHGYDEFMVAASGTFTWMAGSRFSGFFRTGSSSASLSLAFRCSSVPGFRSLDPYRATSF